MERRDAEARLPLIVVGPATVRQRAAALVLLAGAAGAAWALGGTNPVEVPWLPRCPSALLLGLQCPGCGSTRAMHHLLNLDLAAAWRHNPLLMLLGVPALAILLAAAVLTLAAGRRVCLALRRGTGMALAILLVLYMVMRNLPHSAFDGWRPPPVEAQGGYGPARAPKTTSAR